MIDGVIVCYSKEFEANGLPWRVETAKNIYYAKHVEISVPSFTVTRKNATPAYVLKCYGKIKHDLSKQTVIIEAS